MPVFVHPIFDLDREVPILKTFGHEIGVMIYVNFKVLRDERGCKVAM